MDLLSKKKPPFLTEVFLQLWVKEAKNNER